MILTITNRDIVKDVNTRIENKHGTYANNKKSKRNISNTTHESNTNSIALQQL